MILQSFQKSFSEFKWLAWLALVLLVIYVGYRAFTFSITHDEALSISMVQGFDYQRTTANNHVLNTFFMENCYKWFGDSEFSMRLPNVLSCVLYVLATFFILRRENTILVIFGAGLLCLNPALVEYFTLARGYGLSVGFMLMSIYFLTTLAKKDKPDFDTVLRYLSVILFAFLATNANLTMINYFIASTVYSLFHFFIKNSFKYTSKWVKVAGLLLFLGSGVALFFEMQRLLLLQDRNELYFGTDSFLEMFQSMALNSIYAMNFLEWAIDGLKFVLFGNLILGLILIIWKRAWKQPIFIIWLILVMIFGGLIFEHFIFKAHYPVGRSTLFFIPLFAVYSFYLVAGWIEALELKKIIYVPVLTLLLVPFILNFSESTKIKTTREWAFDSHTKFVMDYLQKELKNNKEKATIANNWLLEPAMNYYIDTKKINLHRANRNPIDFNTDYIYRLDDHSMVKGYEMVLRFQNTNLLKRQKNQ